MATIKELRLALGISQTQLGMLAGGLSQPAIWRMETGKPVQPASFRAVCQALGVKPEEITGVKLHSAIAAAAKRTAKRGARQNS